MPGARAAVLSARPPHPLAAGAHGAVAGLLGGLFLAVTPISAIVDRNNTMDSLLILLLLLWAWAASVATERGSLRLLVLAAIADRLGIKEVVGQSLLGRLQE